MHRSLLRSLGKRIRHFYKQAAPLALISKRSLDRFSLGCVGQFFKLSHFYWAKKFAVPYRRLKTDLNGERRHFIFCSISGSDVISFPAQSLPLVRRRFGAGEAKLFLCPAFLFRF